MRHLLCLVFILLCGAPVQAGAIGALMHEGLAATAESAERMAARGDVCFEPCHHHQTVGPMAGMMDVRSSLLEDAT